MGPSSGTDRFFEGTDKEPLFEKEERDVDWRRTLIHTKTTRVREILLLQFYWFVD